jgi:phosphate transport system permease protein
VSAFPLEEEPATFVRTLPVDTTNPDRPLRERRRLLGGVRPEDRIVLAATWLAGLALAWLICTRILPWTGLLAFSIVFFCCGLLLVTVTTYVTTGRSDVGDRIASSLVHAGSLVVGLALVSIILFTFIKGAGGLPHLALLTDDMSGVGPRDPLNQGGILHAILGTFIEVGIAIAVTLPLGVGTAIYMTEVGGQFAKVVRTVVEAMTALPSIVAGLFIYTTLIMSGFPSSGLAAACALGVMMLPIIARASDVVLRVVPGGLREASLALGASRWRTVWSVVLPTARPGLATALILGIARGVGETSPVLLTSGASTFFNLNPVDKVMNSLPLFIFTTVRSGEPIYITRAFAAATVLLVIVLALFIAARMIARTNLGSR